MSKTALIIQREFSTRVRKKSFVIMTLLSPFLFAALIFVPMWLATIDNDTPEKVAVYDRTGRYLSVLKGGTEYTFEPVADCDAPGLYSDTTAYEAVVSITGDPAADPKAVTIYSRKEVPSALLRNVQTSLSRRVREERLAASGIAGIDTLVAKMQEDVPVATVKRSSDGADHASSTEVAMAAGFVFTMLIYLFMSTYGAMVMQSVTEEKTNRIVELIISSVRPFELMLGKIVGIALVGFVQIAIWGVMLFAILSVAGLVFGVPMAGGAAALAGAQGAAAANAVAEGGAAEIFTAIAGLPYTELCVMFALYFIGGYLLYASFFAAAGASVSEQEDSSQFVLPLILVLLFGFYAAIGSVENPNGPLAFWASLFPLTSPVVMMVRIPFSVPLWQELLSLALLYATALLFVWLGGKIYRTGILMYGKKPTLREIARWLRVK